MAVWQFVVQLIPTEWIDLGNDIDTLFNEEGCEPAVAWKNRPDSDVARISKALDVVLPRGKAWSEEQLVWGDERTNDAQLWLEGGHVESLKVRFDLRQREMALISGIVALAKELNLSLVVPEHRHNVGADISSLLPLLEGSGAASYVRDPSRFLSGRGQH